MHQIQNLKDALGLRGYTLAPGPGPMGPWGPRVHLIRGNFMQVCPELNAIFTELETSREPLFDPPKAHSITRRACDFFGKWHLGFRFFVRRSVVA